MNDPVYDALERALELTHRMVSAAEHDHWHQVGQMMQRRDAMLPQRGSTNATHSPLLRALRLSNEKVLEQARRRRMEIQSRLNEHRHNHRAVSSYLVAAR